jgi:fatty acid desaturase
METKGFMHAGAAALPGAAAGAGPAPETGAIAARYRALRSDCSLIPREELRELAQPRPLRSALAIAGEWAGIALAIALFQAFPHPALYPLLVVWIGARMLSLWVLTHEGLHHLLFRDRVWSDRVTRLLLAWPIFLSLSDFRRQHLRHHRHLKTESDPESDLAAFSEFRFPKTRARLAGILLLDATGVNFLRYFARRRLRDLSDVFDADRRRALLRRGPGAGKLAYYGAVLAAVATFGWWTELALFWLVPYATWYAMTLRMRLMAEHQHVAEGDSLQTRTILPNALERWLFTPHGVHYHTEHHLHPDIPCHQLPRAHALLRRSPAFAAGSPVRRGYLRAFREFCAQG